MVVSTYLRGSWPYFPGTGPTPIIRHRIGKNLGYLRVGYHPRLWFFEDPHSHCVPKKSADRVLLQAGLLGNIGECSPPTDRY